MITILIDAFVEIMCCNMRRDRIGNEEYHCRIRVAAIED